MSNQVYKKKKEFIIVPVKHGYIVINTHKPFKEGHTHLGGIGICMRIIDWSLKNKIPKVSSTYILTSLIRLTEDEKYKIKLQELISVRKNKGHRPKYIRRT